MKQTVRIGKHEFRQDWGFLLILIVLFATSCFALYNSFNLISSGSGSYYLNRQIMWYCVGFIVLFLITRVPNHTIYEYLTPVYKVLLAILAYLLLSRITDSYFGFALPLASSVNGAYSWIQIPFIGSFQASEFMKVLLIIKTSQIISSFQAKHANPTWADDLKMFWEIAKWAVPPMILILLEPDTGVFIIIAFTLLVLILCSGVRRFYIVLVAVLIAVLGIGFFWLYFEKPELLSSVVSTYQLNRIEAWLNPEEHILGSSNQLYTALLSLGSAGLTGYGMQANIIAIPEAHTDFIFAAFGQCFGLLGTTYILVICLWLDLYLCKMAYNSTNQTNRLMIIGTIAMLFYQQFQNLGMIIGLVPITGITLPLISYGGSSTLSYFILFGLIMNVSPVSRQTFRIGSRPKRKKTSAKSRSPKTVNN